MGYRFSKGWDIGGGGKRGKWSREAREEHGSGSGGSGSGGTKGSGSGGTKGSGSGGTKGSDGSKASGTKSYHNGGVEGATFARWYDEHLANKFDGEGEGEGSGGTKGTGSGGTKGSGSGGTKGSGSGGTKGSGSGGTKGSGSGGTKGSGSGGTKGSGSGGTKGSGSGGTKGSGSGGTKGSGSGGTKGSGSGGTKGSGSGGTEGSGSGGTKGSGSGGTQGSDTGDTPGGDTGGNDVSKLQFVMGETGEVTITVTEEPGGHQLHFSLAPSDPTADSHADIDGIFFNVAPGSSVALGGDEGDINPDSVLNFYPAVNSEIEGLTNVEVDEDNVTALPNGAEAGGAFDIGLQFGATENSSEGEVNAAGFTLWTHPGTLSLEDFDLAGMRLIVDSDDGDGGDVLEVTSIIDPSAADPGGDDMSSDAMALMDTLSLPPLPPEEEDGIDPEEDDVYDMA